MEKLPCYIILDLLPLYLEGEVSPETKGKIEEHLADCSKCRECWQKGTFSLDFDQIEEEQEVISQAYNVKRLISKVKRFFLVCLISFIGLAVLVGLISYPLGIKVGRQKVITKVDSENKLQEYFYKKIPGLKRAEQLGLVKENGLEMDLGEGMDLRIERIWYNEDYIYLFYSIPFAKDKQQYLIGDLLWKEGNFPLRTSGFSDRFSPGEGAVWQDRFYSVLTFTPFQEEIDGNWIKVERIGEISFKGRVVRGDEQYEVKNIVIPINLDLSKDVVYSVKINQKLELDNLSILWEKIEIRSAKNLVYFQVEQPAGQRLVELNAYLLTDQGEKSYLKLLANESDLKSFKAEFSAFNEIPGRMSLVVEGIVLAGKDVLSFELDPDSVRSKWDGENMVSLQTDKYLTTIHNSKIYLEELIYDERGLAFQLRYDQIAENKPFERLVANNPPNINLRDKENNSLLPNLVEARNEKGEEAEYGQRGSGPEQRIMLFLNKEFVDSSKLIKVKIKNLTYELIGDWQFKIGM
ncbi:MAG TPA: hypothetical protein GXX38_01595 [Clostridia bacterium]|nr:hypothetical protein [Clostridia bacterium]